MFKLNWTPSPSKSTDISFTSVKPAFTALQASSTDQYIIAENYPIYNQLTLGSCVANSTVGALEILMAASGSPIELSRLFVYWNARVYSGGTDKDEGTYITDAFDSLRKLGVCLENTFPYDTSRVFEQPSLEAYKEGNDNTISNFYSITTYDQERLHDIETSIRSNHPVVFGTNVSQEYTQYSGDDSVIWTFPNKSVGGHAQLIVGVRTVNGKKNFLIRNSWGTNWGLSSIPGHAWFDESYITNDATTDLWVPTLIPNLIF